MFEQKLQIFSYQPLSMGLGSQVALSTAEQNLLSEKRDMCLLFHGAHKMKRQTPLLSRGKGLCTAFVHL